MSSKEKNTGIQPSEKNSRIIQKEYNKWLALLHCTESADFRRAKRAATMLYKLSGYKYMPKYVCLNSPMEFSAKFQEISIKLPTRWVGSSLRSALHPSGVTISPGEMQGSSKTLTEEVATTFGMSSIRPWGRRISLNGEFSRQFLDIFTGIRSIAWDISESYKDVLYVIGARPRHKSGVAKLLARRELAKSIGFWYPTFRYCFLIDRPELIRLDEQFRFHSETGPALKFRCGKKFYAWHGTQIPKNWIMNKKKIDPATVFNERNMERRRAAGEILGWHNIIKQLDTKIIDKNPDPQIGTLVEVSIPNPVQSNWSNWGDPGTLHHFLLVKCGTGREFALEVPTWIRNAQQANAWGYGKEFDWQNFKPEVRT